SLVEQQPVVELRGRASLVACSARPCSSLRIVFRGSERTDRQYVAKIGGRIWIAAFRRIPERRQRTHIALKSPVRQIVRVTRVHRRCPRLRAGIEINVRTGYRRRLVAT